MESKSIDDTRIAVARELQSQLHEAPGHVVTWQELCERGHLMTSEVVWAGIGCPTDEAQIAAMGKGPSKSAAGMLRDCFNSAGPFQVTKGLQGSAAMKAPRGCGSLHVMDAILAPIAHTFSDRTLCASPLYASSADFLANKTDKNVVDDIAAFICKQLVRQRGNALTFEDFCVRAESITNPIIWNGIGAPPAGPKR
eukprot:4457688-Prymnesium_polylepis.1